MAQFSTKESAVAFFAKSPEGLLDWYDTIADAVEECEICGEYSVSAADHSEGSILSADPDEMGCDRACARCEE